MIVRASFLQIPADGFIRVLRKWRLFFSVKQTDNERTSKQCIQPAASVTNITTVSLHVTERIGKHTQFCLYVNLSTDCFQVMNTQIWQRQMILFPLSRWVATGLACNVPVEKF
jgi:hypothetical protein